MMNGESMDLLEALRRPPLVSEGVPATAALEAFKSSGVPVALVIDERGNCEGLVTLTDILEAFIGERCPTSIPRQRKRRSCGARTVRGW